jgi:hypothetical protein
MEVKVSNGSDGMRRHRWMDAESGLVKN